LQGLEIAGERCGPDGLCRTGQAVLFLGAIRGQRAAEAGDQARLRFRLRRRIGARNRFVV
jgi:hypothetical protein